MGKCEKYPRVIRNRKVPVKLLNESQSGGICELDLSSCHMSGDLLQMKQTAYAEI